MIGPNHVLTAAHCMGRDFEIVVGEHAINNDEDGTHHRVCRKTIHPRYNKGASLNYDFAIIRLKEPVILGIRAVPACLADSSLGGDALVGKTVIASGWGRLSEGGNQAVVLHSVSLPVITPSECKQAYGSSSVTDAMLCAGNIIEGGIDSCQGDSGGKKYIFKNRSQ